LKEYNQILKELKELLKSKNLKYTKQREVILNTIYKNAGHHTPEDILMLIKKDYPKEKIGIATIYRTLSLFEDASLVESISFGKDGKKYEIGHRHHHDHLICIECGEIIEFVDEIIEKQQKIVSSKYNFHMIDHTMQIVGYCQTCYNKKKESKVDI